MSQELLYTSAPRGLKPGSRGFCTVLSTQGMAAPLTTALEGLSGYRPVYPTGDDRADRNPVVYSHLKLQSSGRTVNVLSRIADFGLDYSQRANKLAHHVVLDRTELLPGGPANLLSMRDFMRDEWSGEPTVIALKPVKRETDPPSGVCRAWQELTGDAGWAGVLAESFLQAPDRLVVLLFAPGQDILPLFHEAISLLPVERRWDVTFSTYFTGLATGTTCSWRAIVQDSKDAHESLRFVNALRLDLTSRSLGRATGGPLVDAARSGSRPHNTQGRATSRTGPADVTFAEAERVHVEFSSEDRTPASFRRTVASPQPSKQLPAQSAPPQQPPLEREPSYKMLPTTTSSAPQSRPPRSLADVIEAESQRPAAGLGMWLGLGALALSFAALLSVVFMRPARDDNDQDKLANDRPGQQSKDAHKVIARTHDGLGKKPGTIVVPPGSAEKQGDGDKTVETKGDPSKDAANSAKGTDGMLAGSKPGESQQTPASKGGTASQGTAQSRPVPHVIPYEPKLLPTADKATELHEFDIPKGKSLNDYLKKLPDGSPAWRGVLPEMVLLRPEWQHYVDGKVPTDIAKVQPSAIWAVLDKSINPDTPIPIGLFIAADREAPKVHYRLTSRDDTKTAELGWYRIRILSPVPGNPPIKDIAFCQFRVGNSNLPLNRNIGKKELIWKLIVPDPMESTVKPQPTAKLVLDRLTIKIGEQTISLDENSRDPKSAWTCSLDEFTSKALKSFPDNTVPASNKLELKLELATGNEGPEIKLQIGVQTFLDGIEKKLDSSLNMAESDISRSFKTIYDKPKVAGNDSTQDPKVAEIEGMLKGCTAEKPSRAAEISERLQMAMKDAKRQLKADELKKVEEKLGKAKSLYESLKEFPTLKTSLNSVTVISARLYYTLTGATKNAAGETIKLTEGLDVDVVNFDDSTTGDLKSDHKMQLKAGKKEGDAKP